MFLGELSHTILPNVLHTGVTFFHDYIYAVTNYAVFPNGVVSVYALLKNRWQSIQVIYMPSSCSYEHSLSIQIADNKLHVCNATNSAVYIYSLKGALVHEHTGREASYLCALDVTGLLEAQVNTTTLSVLAKGAWQNGVVSGLNKDVKGAVVFERKLYVACSDGSAGCLQLYNIE